MNNMQLYNMIQRQNLLSLLHHLNIRYILLVVQLLLTQYPLFADDIQSWEILH